MSFCERFNKLVENDYANAEKKLNLNRTTIWSWRKGRSTPNIDYLIMICKAYNVSADWLLGLSTDENDSCENQ